MIQVAMMPQFYGDNSVQYTPQKIYKSSSVHLVVEVRLSTQTKIIEFVHLRTKISSDNRNFSSDNLKNKNFQFSEIQSIISMTAKQREKKRLTTDVVLNKYVDFDYCELLSVKKTIDGWIEEYSSEYEQLILIENIASDWGDESREWQLIGRRKETDEEMDTRINNTKLCEERQKAHELEFLAKLKAKYEGK